MKRSKSLLIFTITSLTIVGLLLFSFIAGYRFFFIETPSMGQTAPVGTLVVTHPKTDYGKGDIVSFYRSNRVYTHRIVGKSGEKFITRGDLNSSDDALLLSKNDIIGSSVFVGKYLGWVWKALPIIVLGWTLVYLFSLWKKIRVDWRWPVRIIGGTLVVMIATIILNPWLRVEMIGYMPTSHNSVSMSVVNTGIFPIREEDGGRFYAGEVRTVALNEIDDKGRFVYIPRPSLGFWGLILVLIWCLSPMIVAMLVKLPLPEELKKMKKEEFISDKRKNLILFVVITIVSILMLLIQISSLAAFTVAISNSENNLRSAYFNCRGVVSPDIANPKPILAYALDNINSSESDISGNSNHGSKTGNFFPVNNPDACVRDNPRMGVRFNGVNTCVVSNKFISPRDLSFEIWFSTNSVNRGKLIGFEADNVVSNLNSNYSGSRPANDRNLYIDKDGRLIFGYYPGSLQFISSTSGVSYADGNWHHAVVTMSNDEGTKMYIDGVMVSSNSRGVGENHSNGGYWKIGCGSLWNWRNADGSRTNGSRYFDGGIRYVSVYNTALSEAQIREHYQAGKNW